jgi:hypothetical protein
MVWRREIETKQPKHRCDQSFGLAQRQTKDHPQRQRRRDRQGRVARLAAARAAGLDLPRRNRRFREPGRSDFRAGARRCHRPPNSSLCAAASGCDDGDLGSL